MNKEPVDIGIAIKHLKSGGAIRRKCWRDGCKIAFWRSHPVLHGHIYYMPNETIKYDDYKRFEGWARFEGFDLDDILAEDWELEEGDTEEWTV
jgi:hypothetical protein